MVSRMEYHLYDDLVKWAREHLPEEACGLLAGTEDGNGREIKKVYFLENKDHAEDHFTLDPMDQMKAVKDMRANGYKLLGNWHSHPSSPSRPSLMAEHPVVNVFHIEAGEWTKEDLRIYSDEYYF